MPIPETILSAIVEAVFGYALDQSGAADWLRSKTNLDPERRAFQRALGQALVQLEEQHPDWVRLRFDPDFLHVEGAPILAQFLTRSGRPDPSALAAAWADAQLLRDPESRTPYTRDLEPVAADFLEALAAALKRERPLDDLHDSRAREQMAADLAALRRKLGADEATPGARRDYLHWLIEQNLYLDPRGSFQTQRQVQVRLDEVYIALRAQREQAPGSVDRRLLEQERGELEERLKRLELPSEEVEDRLDQLLLRWERRHGEDAIAPGQVLELAAAVRQHDKLAILGDPGSGKTTLLRYLALQHAQAQREDRQQAGPEQELGPGCFPVLVRIAEYAEGDVWRRTSLSDFLADACALRECPRRGLADLLSQALAAGRCLILLDGLDEIVDADDRRGIVKRIEDFVRRHDGPGNRFVVTSRIAGYRSAPLGPAFAHYTVQEMDDGQIRRFLERWCPAVEAAQTPDLSEEARQATAQREIDSIMRAVEDSPGVRRLAANPLLLRTLALIHRTGAQLPQRRIELYKLAADTLARTWRTAQGVPETALVADRYLTPLLARLAYEIHLHKPTGLATEREVYEILGGEWARIKRLDEATQQEEIQGQVDNFLRAVREHTGLFVERAPRRYGFMHLTFEEYYAARHLVRLSRKRAQLIRQHLHDPRWQEPILLALGFVGLDYPEEAAELLETAVLAQGEEAEALGFRPSPYEDLLGRDHLFALRCLGDQIPADPAVVQALMERLAEELLHRQGLMRFSRYEQALEERLEQLAGSEAAGVLRPLLLPEKLRAWSEQDRAAAILDQLRQASQVISELLDALQNSDRYVREQALINLVELRQASPVVIGELLDMLQDSHRDTRARAAYSLGQLGHVSLHVIGKLLDALRDSDRIVRHTAATSLGRLGHASPRVISGLLDALQDSDGRVRWRATVSLGQLGQASPKVVNGILNALRDSDENVRRGAASSLGQMGHDLPVVISGLLDALQDSDWDVRRQAVTSLGQLGQATPDVVTGLLETLRDSDEDVSRQAVASLGQLGQASPAVVAALIETLADDNLCVRAGAAESLGQLGQTSPAVVAALIEALADDDPDVRTTAAQSLGQLGQASPTVVELLRQALQRADLEFRRRDAARSLGQIGSADEATIAALLQGLLYEDNSVRTACAEALARLGRRFPGQAEAIAGQLVQAIQDPAFAKPARYRDRSGQDYAYDALWLLVVGGAG